MLFFSDYLLVSSCFIHKVYELILSENQPPFFCIFYAVSTRKKTMPDAERKKGLIV